MGFFFFFNLPFCFLTQTFLFNYYYLIDSDVLQINRIDKEIEVEKIISSSIKKGRIQHPLVTLHGVYIYIYMLIEKKKIKVVKRYWLSFLSAGTSIKPAW